MEEVFAYLIANKLELFAFLFGVTCVYLNTKENVWGWPIGIIGVSLYIPIFWEGRLYGDFILHIIYAVLGAYGWYNWLYGNKEKKALPITYSSHQELGLLLLIGVIATLLFGYYLDNYVTSAAYPYWDATTTVFSLIAQYQLTQKKIENWLVWIVVDLLCIGIYYFKGYYLSSVLYTIYTALAVMGYLQWKQSIKKGVS